MPYSLAALAALTTFIVYRTALQNDFIDLDDALYVLENASIRSFDLAFLRWAFSDFYAANWHPLTWMSHALDYAVWGLNPFGHHLTSVILHAVNTFVVALLAMRLIKAAEGPAVRGAAGADESTILTGGAITGLLFGLHPFHVESVAWISERKDLLCALFFLLSIIGYMKYAGVREPESKSGIVTDRKKFIFNKHYLIALGFFALALLSKPMAVTLPLVLLILDWYPLERVRSMRTLRAALIEKLPFLALSFASSVITIIAQKTGEAFASTAAVPASGRLLVASQSLILYLLKIILPYNLIPFYPYPAPGEASFRHAVYPLAIVTVVAITAACISQREKRKYWLVLWCYFLITLVPVIGILQVGGQAMADRYMYLPSLGPFLAMGFASAWVWRKISRRTTLKVLSVLAAALTFIFLASLTIKQIGVWKNSVIFWDYVIEKEPDGNSLAYNNRGILYGKQGLFDKAIEYFDRSIAISTNCVDCYYNRGLTYSIMGQNGRALDDFNKALALKQNLPDAYFSRGGLYLKTGQKQLALADFRRACELGDEMGCDALRTSAERKGPE